SKTTFGPAGTDVAVGTGATVGAATATATVVGVARAIATGVAGGSPVPGRNKRETAKIANTIATPSPAHSNQLIGGPADPPGVGVARSTIGGRSTTGGAGPPLRAEGGGAGALCKAEMNSIALLKRWVESLAS